MSAGYHWGPLDRGSLTPLGRKSAEVAGLHSDTYRAGVALFDRAPIHILAAWTSEELTTADAYARLMAWESGRLL